MQNGTNGSIGSMIPSYTGAPRVTARRCNALAIMLAKVAPPDITGAQRRKLDDAVERAGEVDDVISARERVSTGRLQGPRLETTNAWSACHEALQAGARLPRHLGDHGERAERVLGSLLPDGLAFTKLDAVELWGHSQRLVERVDAEGFRAEIEALIGPQFLRAIEDATRTLGNAIGVGDGRPAPSRTALAQAVGRFTSAVGAYARSLAADVVENDEVSVKRFLDAVAPIDEHRSRPGANDEDEAGEPTPSTPVTPVAPAA